MTEYAGSDDIYKELVQNSDDNWLYGLVTFALIEEQRIEWMKHFEENNNGNSPTVEEITNWYKQQPPSAIIRAKGEAENALQAFSADVVDITLDGKHKEIEEGIIIAEIQNSRKFWPQFGVNFIGGLTSAFVFAALLIIVAFFVLNDTSASQLGSQLRNNINIGGN